MLSNRPVGASLTPLQLAEVGVAVALGIALDVLVPEKRRRDVLALPSAPVARRTERVESGFRELSGYHAHPVAEIRS